MFSTFTVIWQNLPWALLLRNKLPTSDLEQSILLAVNSNLPSRTGSPKPGAAGPYIGSGGVGGKAGSLGCDGTAPGATGGLCRLILIVRRVCHGGAPRAPSGSIRWLPDFRSGYRSRNYDGVDYTGGGVDTSDVG
ncbi:hypothetical protein GCM10010435_85660 [Winogradskya consettensis]|uniref:Uncharacterized protein n=1 Tax=Winogradskya consettensis TaxID=113560 RepID=A0A919SIV9_9ACTN|nr:hypothetical protein [Actinoplanes consettensis]GIM72524.1 hypothetical protein Aco04nite_30730 [Actinoplanes consettensis]